MALPATVVDANARTDSVIEQSQSFIDQLADLANDDRISINNWQLTLWDFNLRSDVALNAVDTISTTDAAGLKDLQVDPTFDIPLPPAGAEVDYYNKELPAVWTDNPVPEFTDIAPTVDAPEKPTTVAPTAPGDYNVSEITELVPWETIALPADVVLSESVFEKLSPQEIDTISLTIPELDILLPTNNFSYVEETYSSELMTSLQELLVSDILNEGYGINTGDELQIYERAREREAKQAAAAVDQARKGIAARNFPVPPGTLYAIEQVILKEGAMRLAETNREIVLTRSDLYLKARQFAVQQGISLENALLSFVSAKHERALKAAQLSADFVIQFHNAAVQLFQVKVELKQLTLDVHKVRLQAVATRLQEYGQELAFIDTEDRHNQLRIQEYNQKLEGIRIFYDAQRSRDEHAKLSIEIERLKLQAHQERVSTYATQVQARADEFELYSTAWKAEGIKQDVFSSQVAAYAQRVDAIATESRLKQERFKAEIENLDKERERHNVLLQQYDAKLRQFDLDFTTDSRINQEKLDMWRVNRDSEQQNVENKFRQNVEHIAKLLDAQNSNIAMMQAGLNGILQWKELNGSSAKAALDLYQQAIEGASSALTVIESI